MKKIFHCTITAILAFVHPFNKMPSFVYFCKHVEGEPLTEEEKEFLKLTLPEWFR